MLFCLVHKVCVCIFMKKNVMLVQMNNLIKDISEMLTCVCVTAASLRSMLPPIIPLPSFFTTASYPLAPNLIVHSSP